MYNLKYLVVFVHFHYIWDSPYVDGGSITASPWTVLEVWVPVNVYLEVQKFTASSSVLFGCSSV